jgi:large subunit ribosomal protein L4
VLVVDDWGLDQPRTKDALAALHALGLRTKGEHEARLLLVLDRTEEAAWKSFRNLGRWVQIVLPEELNVYDVLVNDWLVFSKATLVATNARLSGTSADASDSSTSDASTNDRSTSAGEATT